jgi:predicted acetyltransferase
MSAAEDAAIRAGLCLCFPPDREVFSRTRAWHGTRPAWSVLVEMADRIVAHAAIVERQVLVGGEKVRVAGALNVFVLPDCRGQGLFRQVMSSAMDEAYRRRSDFGLLFCTPEIGAKYERLGWRLLADRRVTRIDEQGQEQPLPAKNVTLFHPLRRSDFPAGDIHLLGNDW